MTKTKIFRKIPKNLLEDISRIKEESFRIGSVTLYNPNVASSIPGPLNIWEMTEFVSDSGRIGQKNVVEDEIYRKDLPKISKVICAGERPIFGDYNKGIYDLVYTRLVWAKEIRAPRQWSMRSELKEYRGEKWVESFLVREFSSKDDRADILFGINMVHELFGSVQIFGLDQALKKHIPIQSVDWELLPPAQRETFFQWLAEPSRGVAARSTQRRLEVAEFLKDIPSIAYIKGSFWSKASYFWVKLTENIIILDSYLYWNALYLIYEDWESVSKKSRTELMSRKNDSYIRILHKANWQRIAQFHIEQSLKKKSS